LVADDRHNYRVAFVEAFRRRGIYPVNIDAPTSDTLRTLAVDTLRWEGFEWSKGGAQNSMKQYEFIIKGLKRFADACLYVRNRRELFKKTYHQRIVLRDQLKKVFAAAPSFAGELGLDPAQKFDVHELRHAMRVGPDGKQVPQIIVALTQSRTIMQDRENSTPEYLFKYQ
jgi:hypothetical protein